MPWAPDAEPARTARDVSLLAVAAVVAMIAIIIFSTATITRYLRGVVEHAGLPATAAGSAVWDAARRADRAAGPPA